HSMIELIKLTLVISFFFHAEVGIRYRNVTGVQTCALPISARGGLRSYRTMRNERPDFFIHSGDHIYADCTVPPQQALPNGEVWRSEERRVGKEWREVWSPATEREVRNDNVISDCRLIVRGK